VVALQDALLDIIKLDIMATVVDVAKRILVDGVVLAALRTDNVDIVVKNILFQEELEALVVQVDLEEDITIFLGPYQVLVGLQVVLETVVDPQQVQLVELVVLVENGHLVEMIHQTVGLVVLLVEQSLVPIIP